MGIFVADRGTIDLGFDLRQAFYFENDIHKRRRF